LMVILSRLLCLSEPEGPATYKSFAYPTGPWERIHVGFEGPFLGSMFLIVIDANGWR